MRGEESSQQTDIIIGLGSSDMRTAEWCAELYKKGTAPRILFTGARGRISRDLLSENEADLYAKTAVALGVQYKDILIEAKATNTGENIRFSYELLSSQNLSVNAITLVTKPYMLKRAHATFMKQWPAKKKPIVHCSSVKVSFEEYCNDVNYPDTYVTNVMVGDLQRIREYPKLGFQIEQQIPDNVWTAWEALVKNGYTKHLLDANVD